jgi:signal transduction histidine kinase
VALYRILIVDDSAAVRETVSILLGGEYEVHASRLDEYIAKGFSGSSPHLIIAPRGAAGHGDARPFPPDVPVLWIAASDESSDGGHGPSLPRRFSPRDLRRRVAELLAEPLARNGATTYGARLRPPYVTSAAARALTDGVATEVPLHLVGEPGVGKRSVARAIHAAGRSGPFLTVSAKDFDAAVLTAPRQGASTLFIDRVEQLAASAQHTLLLALDPAGLVRTADGGGLRVITTATEELGAAVDAGAFSPDLYYRLTVLTVRLAPLRERSADIPALAPLLAAELAALLGRGRMTLTDRALARLANYLWFGNLAELEAVLARSIALCRETVIDADDLIFDGAHSNPERVDTGAIAPDRRAALGSRPLDLIINELAHEFKNPLVTIKTFAHHLHRSLSCGGEEAQVARLTGDAVEQIDRTLENLLEFTRLEAPVPQAVSLAAVLDPVIELCARSLAARGVILEHPPTPTVAVRGDPHQLAYALTNLVRALSRDLGPPSRIALRYAQPAALTIELPPGADPFGSHLATLLDRASDNSPAVPLGMAIAHAVLERNGAQVALADDTPSRVTVRFSPADAYAEVAGNGKSPRTGR